ncbi:pyruvate kinase [Patescibacteria group bacterium]|nr:pyruvate kinase [Patescibacteria group bacterium]
MNVQNKKTKIVATIGPVTKSEEMLSQLLKAGFNIMRLNFSHGDFEEHQIKVDNLRKAIKKTGIQAAIMQDLGGPKIRIGNFKNGVIDLKVGQTFTLTTEDVEGDETRVSVNYKPLPKEVQVGGFILLHDGKKKLEIIDIKGNEIITKVLVGGETKNKRGINLPGAHLSISSLTDKDKKDLQFALKNKLDFVAFSFVRRAEDIVELRNLLNKAKSEAKIIAKVEDVEGLENIDSIIELVDGVMVARGDMAIEIGAENVPMVQKSIIKKCNEQGKMVITATHMLESMISSPVPTRAEVSDIANAIIDGTDAIMLSEETTLGQFPVESVEVMTRVALNIENDEFYMEQVLERQDYKHASLENRVADAITNEAVDIANTLDAKAIVAFTNSGFTARMISRYKPLQPILALTPNEKTAKQLLMSFGVMPIQIEKTTMLNDVLKLIRTHCIKNKIAEKGDKVVVAIGMPFGKKVDTNMLLVETI